MEHFDANEFEEMDDNLNPNSGTISSTNEKEEEYESLQLVRNKLAAMEAESQKVMIQKNEKETKDCINDTNGNSVKNKVPILSCSNPSVQSPSIPDDTNKEPTTDTLGEATLDPTLLQPKEDQKALDERSVFIKNVRVYEYTLEVDELKQYFESCGAIERVTIIANKFTGQPKGFAYVQFKSKVAVANALLLNGKTWKGKVIEVALFVFFSHFIDLR
ncbi:hypothetical protein RFI_02371 [Reticulomyxa filosa]|uniref:RRM domain-containing protein n=1 Tax=Reticulomyxa filosa TaxID=46433 RepID=X6P858_RETFI|nr:hypothetical protein RFI_02371 [Reticulomyxa filosa]|eukprot:ETO34725.1 hypothetical protein RFI_02371 [Reticulomyxa filosa]